MAGPLSLLSPSPELFLQVDLQGMAIMEPLAKRCLYHRADVNSAGQRVTVPGFLIITG